MRVLYFAWVRETVGAGEEVVDLPAEVETAADLADLLARQGAGHARAFSDRGRLCVAIDQRMARFENSVAGAKEVAFFLPVTGG